MRQIRRIPRRLAARAAAGLLVFIIVTGLSGVSRAWAQDAAPAAAPATPGEIETDPIQCWWRADRTAVRVGEPIVLTLTCGVIETRSIRVVPNLTELDPSTIELTPFEVLGGETYEDIVAPPWRYFQFEYRVRLIGEEQFGEDVEIPALTVTYNVQSSEGGGVQGRDQRYLMPTLPVRVFSLVPEAIDDIRDASTATFSDIEARRFRASELLVAAGILFGLAVVLVGVAVVRGLGQYRVRIPPALRRASLPMVVHACLRELARVRADVQRNGWSTEAVGRALAVYRVAAAVALRRPVAQAVAPSGVPARQGQVLLKSGLIRRRRILVSAAVTGGGIERELTSGRGAGRSERSKVRLEQLRDVLTTLSTARYAREAELDAQALDQVLAAGLPAVRELRWKTLLPGAAPAPRIQVRRAGGLG